MKTYSGNTPTSQFLAVKLEAIEHDRTFTYSTGRKRFLAFIPKNTKEHTKVNVPITQWAPGSWLWGLWNQTIIIVGDHLWFEEDGKFIRCIRAETINLYARFVEYPN